MSKTNVSVNFGGIKKLSAQLEDLGTQYLRQAVDNALNKSKEYVTEKIYEAMENSPYNFKGTGRSHLQTKKSVDEVAKMENISYGTIIECYVGVSWYDAPEATLLAFGTPHIPADFRLHNALKVKGAIAKEVKVIQKEEFLKVLKEAQNG